MKKQPHPWKSVLACVGAVIGAGFVSGREIYSFFTRYGEASWGLILLSAATMVFLCTLCMRRAQQEQADCWCSLQCFSGTKMGALARGCVTALMLVTGGAMVSAAGHLTELLWPSSWAYPAGAVGTLLLAWLLGSRGVGPLSAVSGFLTFRLSDAAMIRLGCGIIAAGVASLLLPFAGAALAGFVLIGLGCAPVYPCIIHSTPAHFGAERSQALIGVQMACAYIGVCAMPPLFGLIANHISVALLPGYLAVLLVVMAFMHERVLKKCSAMPQHS